MNLDRLLSAAPSSRREALFLDLEQKVNDASGEWGQWSEVDYRYSPRAGRVFQAPIWGLAPENAYVLEANPDPNIRAWYIPEDQHYLRFVTHPHTTLSLKSPRVGDIKVSATSSTRTLLSHGHALNFMIKTHLDVAHFRWPRPLLGKEVEHGVGLSSELEADLCRGRNPNIAILAETLGVVSLEHPDSIGMVVREMTPRPRDLHVSTLIPGFALYSRDARDSSIEPPLLVQIIKRHSHGDPRGFFLNLITWLLRSWIYFVEDRGLVPVMHGQNCLLELGPDGEPHRIVIRDLQDLRPDPEARRRIGLPDIMWNAAGEKPGLSKAQEYSICYDHYFGTYFLARLIQAFSDYLGFDVEWVNGEVAQLFRHYASSCLEEFPRLAYRFTQSEQRNSHTRVVPNGLPRFR